MQGPTFLSHEIKLHSRKFVIFSGMFYYKYLPFRYNRRSSQYLLTSKCQLQREEQTYVKQLVANNFERLTMLAAIKDGHTSETKLGLYEKKLIPNVKTKVHRNKLFVTKPDKGNASIIIYKTDIYQKKKNLF
jgi:hypothetical protein